MGEIKFSETINRLPVEIRLDLYRSIQHDKAIFMPCFFHLPAGSNTEKSRNLYEHKIESSSIIEVHRQMHRKMCKCAHFYVQVKVLAL